MRRKEQRFAVPVFDRWLLHAPLNEVVALVNRSAKEQILSPDHAWRRSSHPAVCQLGEAFWQPAERLPERREGGIDPSMLAIVTTRGCNINCVYCDFGGPTSAKVHMDPAIAVRAIDWMADRLVEHGKHLFFLHFFGGEPLISGDLVDIIVHRVRQVCAEKGLSPYIDVSTNGVINAQRARWVADYFDSVVLSFDGFPEFQNRNRPGNHGSKTFHIVDRTARILSESNLELCLRVCVTGESVSAMPEITRWMAETYRPAILNFEPLTENVLTHTAKLDAADPIAFSRSWVAAKRVADAYGIHLVYSATESEAPRWSSCPVGSDAVVVTPDGTVNGCYLQPVDWKKHGMDFELGRIAPDGGLSLQPEKVQGLRDLIVDKPRCRSCFCQWSCAGGCHVSNTYRGCDPGYVDFCIQTRILTACQLLGDLGEHQLVDRLLADEEALHQLAHHGWDPAEERQSALREAEA